MQFLHWFVKEQGEEVMGKKKYLCRCLKITKKDIKEAIAEGADSFKKVKKKTGVSVKYGHCECKVKKYAKSSCIVHAHSLAAAPQQSRLTSAEKKFILNMQGFLNNSLSSKGKMNMRKPLIIQTDFGTADGAVCAMYGVSYGVDQELQITDLTHEIPQYDIWEASYRLIQTVNYWPEGSVFVSVVDPGVGSTRRSIVVKTTTGQYIVTPDNGTLTHVKRMCGITEARIIDENVNRLPGSGESYTFHGRDIYAYTGARLAAGVITFEGVGPSVEVESVIELPVVEAAYNGDRVSGTIDVLDVRFGSLWTNISRELFLKLGVKHGQRVEISIENETRTLYKNILVYAKSFADVYVGEPLIYVNSLDCMAVAINQGSFAKAYNIGTGNKWQITMRKAPKIIYED